MLFMSNMNKPVEHIYGFGLTFQFSLFVNILLLFLCFAEYKIQNNCYFYYAIKVNSLYDIIQI